MSNPITDDEVARIVEAKRLLREKLLAHPDEGVRAMAEIAEPADDHPSVVAIPAAPRDEPNPIRTGPSISLTRGPWTPHGEGWRG